MERKRWTTTHVTGTEHTTHNPHSLKAGIPFVASYSAVFTERPAPAHHSLRWSTMSRTNQAHLSRGGRHVVIICGHGAYVKGAVSRSSSEDGCELSCLPRRCRRGMRRSGSCHINKRPWPQKFRNRVPLHGRDRPGVTHLPACGGFTPSACEDTTRSSSTRLIIP